MPCRSIMMSCLLGEYTQFLSSMQTTVHEDDGRFILLCCVHAVQIAESKQTVVYDYVNSI